VYIGPLVIAAVGGLAGWLATKERLLERTAVARIDLLSRLRGRPPRGSVESQVKRDRIGLGVACGALVLLAIAWSLTLA
jgi:hypothetical protein